MERVTKCAPDGRIIYDEIIYDDGSSKVLFDRVKDYLEEDRD